MLPAVATIWGEQRPPVSRAPSFTPSISYFSLILLIQLAVGFVIVRNDIATICDILTQTDRVYETGSVHGDAELRFEDIWIFHPAAFISPPSASCSVEQGAKWYSIGRDVPDVSNAMKYRA